MALPSDVMAQPDSCSMTPPESPIFQALQWMLDDDDDIPIPEQPTTQQESVINIVNPACFCCQGEVDVTTNTHPDGPLRRGLIDRTEGLSQHVQLFDFTFDHYTALPDKREILFNFVREGFSELEMASQSTGFSQTGDHVEFLKIRHNIRSLFDYIQEYLKSNDNVTRLVPDLVQDLEELLLFVGRLHELPPSVLGQAASKQGTKSDSPGHHLFHLCMETHWAIIETAQMAASLYPDQTSTKSQALFTYGPESDFCDQMDTVDELVHLLLWDLALLANKTFKKVTSASVTKTGPFMCTCVREMFVLLIQLLQYRQQKYAKQSFWVAVTSVLQNMNTCITTTSGESTEIDSNVYQLPFEVDISDPVGFSWWFLLHVSPLYHYYQYGTYNTSQSTVPHNYFLLQELLKKSLTGTEVPLRQHFRCCLVVMAMWEPNSRVINLLWEHFYKKLSDSFKTQLTGMMGHACVHKSAAMQYENCRRIAENNLQGLEHDNSYELFLRLLSQHLSRSPQPLQGWKQIKGRFYSKFHAGRVQELSDMGIQNLASLFIVVAHVVDTEDVTSKLCDFLGLILAAPSVQPTRRLAVWKAIFALMLLYMRKRLPIGFIAEKITPEFDKLACALSEARDSSKYNMLWPLIALYTESTQEVIEYSHNLDLQEYTLIGKGIGALLPKSRDSDMKYLLSFLQTLLNKYRMVQSRQQELQESGTWCNNPSGVNSLKGLSDRLWQQGYSFIKQHSTTQTPPVLLAEVAAAFCMLAMDVQSGMHGGPKEDFITCFNYFILGHQVHPMISCHFMCHLLPNTEVMDRLCMSGTDYQTPLIQAWFRCHWYLPRTSDHLHQLTRLIMDLPKMSGLMSTVNDQSTVLQQSSTSPVVQFLSALGLKFQSLFDHKMRLQLREETNSYFGDVSKHISQTLKNCASSELVKVVYSLGGHMVKHCSMLLYVNMQPNCIFPNLMDRLILPRSFAVQNKDLPPNIMSAIRECLHLFISGFKYLDYKSDPYLQRKLKEIICLYFTRFPINPGQTSSGTPVHPFVTALFDEQTALRQHILRLIISEHLTGKTQPIQVLQLFLEVIHRSKNSTFIASDCAVLLGPMLTQLIENVHYKAQLTQIVSALLDAAKKHQQVMPKEEVDRICGSIVEKLLPVHMSRVFKSVEPLVSCYMSVFVDLIPTMTATVKGLERKRGLGIDKQLRFSYCNLLMLLGPRGKEEKSKLLIE